MEQKILVVDDDPAICDAVRMALELQGYEVETSEKGEYVEAMTGWDNRFPKLIIMDMFLSGRDGREITKKLKTDYKTHTIPIVMISAHPDAYSEARRAGADDFIPKPFSVTALLTKVEKYMN